MILDGKKVAAMIYQDLKDKITPLTTKPKLGVILVGNNPSSLRYIQQKQKWALSVGIEFELLKFEENTSEKDILKVLHAWNNDVSINGYIIQLPLPSHINEKNIINNISPEKDVDGFHPINQGKILIGDSSGLQACTPSGMMELLKYYNIDPKGKNVTIIGRSNIVGKPIANLLINAQSTVTICNSQTKNIDFFTKNSDIVITALGKPHFLTLDKISKNTIVIDVGFTILDEKIYGDADFENIEKNGNMITPVPGGVGSLTVGMLLKNTFLAYQRQKDLF